MITSHLGHPRGRACASPLRGSGFSAEDLIRPAADWRTRRRGRETCVGTDNDGCFGTRSEQWIALAGGAAAYVSRRWGRATSRGRTALVVAEVELAQGQAPSRVPRSGSEKAIYPNWHLWSQGSAAQGRRLHVLVVSRLDRPCSCAAPRRAIDRVDAFLAEQGVRRASSSRLVRAGRALPVQLDAQKAAPARPRDSRFPVRGWRSRRAVAVENAGLLTPRVWPCAPRRG